MRIKIKNENQIKNEMNKNQIKNERVCHE